MLYDIDFTETLDTITVEGGLIIAPDADPSHERTLDAKQIFVQGGFMEVGTEANPYTSKLTITLHSTRFDAYLPLYGNKVIGVRFGTLDIHGIPKQFTWSRLASTSEIGDDSITLQDEVDWSVGDEIVIAGTEWGNKGHETRFITAISGATLTLDKALTYQHISVTPEYGGVEIPMQAEVGLLTRNVVFRGDPETSERDKYGAHIMVHSPGDESSIGRISYV